MLSELAITYLILGGVGAGCIGVCSVVDLLLVREPFGDADYDQGPALESDSRMLDYCFALGFAVLGAGCACLIFDLGRMDRIVSLFTHPSFTWMTAGAFAIAALLLVGAFLALIRLLYLPWVQRGAVVACEAIAVILSLVVMAYTGLLVSTLGGVAFWSSPWLMPLFLASSVSGGVALVVASSILVSTDVDSARLMHVLAIVDMVAIGAEVIFAGLFLFGAMQSANPGAVAGFEQIMHGSQSMLWWTGFVGCGIIVPIVIEIAFCIGRTSSHVRNGSNSDMLSRAFAIAAVFVLIGVVCMRASIIGAGEHRDLELQDAPIAFELVDEVGNKEIVS